MRFTRILVFLACLPVIALANSTYTLTIDVIEDGQDQLMFSGNTLYWVHDSDYANGGVAGGSVSGLKNVLGNTVTANNPYILVSGTDSSSSPFTNADWYNGIQGLQCSQLPGGCPYSDTTPAYEFTLPSGYSLGGLIGNVTLTTLECAGVAGTSHCGIPILEDPVPSITDHSGVWDVNLDDRNDAGTHEFEVQLSWTTTPEPESAVLVGLGLAALAFVRRKMAR
jgi:hypothetical protein